MTTSLRITEHLWIPLSDGRRLAAKLWLPEQAGPCPAILEYLPYRKRDGTAPRDATTHPIFAATGYACLRVDIAGSGESDGLFDDEYSEQEMRDGESVLAWMAQQDWCDGQIGMIGISWGGFNGLQLAARRPAALKAIVTVCSTVDRYADDIHYMGGCLLTDNFNWGAQMTAYMSRPPDPALCADWKEQWLKRLENLPFSSADWLKTPHRNAYWKHGSVCEDWSAIQAPTLAIGGWADAYVNAPLALAEHLQAPCQALLGPWEHKYPHIARINPADFHGEVLSWFDHWLKGIENGVAQRPAVRAWMQRFDDPQPHYGPAKGRWIAEATWPSPMIEPKRFFLGAGKLQSEPEAGSLDICSPCDTGTNAAYFCPGMRMGHELADDQSQDDQRSLCFDSLPLDTAVEILGRPVISLTFRVDQPVAQICVRLCDVAHDDDESSQRVSYRAMNLCHVSGHEEPAPLIPHKLYHARIALNACAHRFRPGQKIRLAISTSYWPLIWPSPHKATIKVELEHCHLELPIRAEPDTELSPHAPDEPRDFPTIDADIIREADSHTEVIESDDGSVSLETRDDFGKRRYVESDWIEGSHVNQRFAIHPDDPLCASHYAEWQYQFGRDEWHVTIDTNARMTSDADHFYLQRGVVAKEGEETLFERTWREVIPRGLL